MFEEIGVFATVVEQSSINKAAALLNLSQPALSRKIRKLENELGTLLFHRVGKRLELTKIGQLTYDYAIEQRRLHLKYLNTINEMTTAGRGSLTIGASLTTLQTTLPDFIRYLNTSHPGFEIKAVTGKTHEIVTLVRENKVDIGLVATKIEESHLHTVPLFEDHLLLVLPSSLALHLKEPLQINDLNNLPMILFSKGSWYRTLTDELFSKYQLQPDIRMEIDSFEAILRLLNTCRAATLLPQSYLRKQLLKENELTIVSTPELALMKRTTSLIFNHLDRLDPAVQKSIDEISQQFQRDKSKELLF